MASGGAEARGGFRARLFAWYWRRRARRARDPRAFLRLIERHRSTLDAIAARLERRIAEGRSEAGPAPETAADGRWTIRPECLLAPLRPAALTDPPSGAAFGEGLRLHHDGKRAAFTVSQRPARGGGQGPRYEFFFESYEFDGAFFSLTVDAPEELRRPRRDERIAVRLDMVAAWALKGYARLVIRGKDGEETLFAEASFGDGERRFDFDLAFVPFDLGPTDAIWLDLIFDRPRMAEFEIRDLTLSLETAR